MSIITFWNDTKEQSGKTLASIAVATRMAMERNSKILLISTSFNDSTMKDCFWGNEYTKNTNFLNDDGNKNNNIAVENGIEGVIKIAASNKLTPNIITDYTRVIFKERLEVIAGYSMLNEGTLDGKIKEFRNIEQYYIDLIRTANQFYDMVIVDLDKWLSTETREKILQISNVNIYVLSQKLDSINRYKELRKMNGEYLGNKCIPVIGRYDDRFKYNAKNIARYLGDKKQFDLIPLNLLYMEAAEEANVVELFLRLKNVKDKTDENYIFMDCILKITNTIIKKLQEMQMRMR